MAEPPPRVVLDTNVLVSALIAKGRGWNTPPLSCVELAVRGTIQLVASPETLGELLRALRYPKLCVPDDRGQAFVGLVAALTEPDGLVRAAGKLDVLRRDVADNLVLETALAGRASHLVTGNLRHFAELWKHGAEPEYRSVRILTPREFLAARGPSAKP